MDITMTAGQQKFNYRACAMILRQGHILAMHDERSPYYYLPGGRVQLGETAEAAVLREVEEELQVKAEIIRPLWLNQAFFNEDVDHLDYHELCLYFLVDVPDGLPDPGAVFTRCEGTRTHVFEWLDFHRLKDEYFYPVFLKKAIFDLPATFTLRAEREKTKTPEKPPEFSCCPLSQRFNQLPQRIRRQ